MVLALIPAYTLRLFDDSKALTDDGADCDHRGDRRRIGSGKAVDAGQLAPCKLVTVAKLHHAHQHAKASHGQLAVLDAYS